LSNFKSYSREDVGEASSGEDDLLAGTLGVVDCGSWVYLRGSYCGNEGARSLWIYTLMNAIQNSKP
jgi:hypothetical protein